MPRKKYKTNAGPCPDPLRYILVRGKYGKFWRLKRGTNKPATLNAGWEASRKNTSISSPAAKYILQKLGPHIAYLAPGSRLADISGKLRKALNENGSIDYRHFKGYDIQEDHPLHKLLKANIEVSRQKDMLYITIKLAQDSVKALNTSVTHFYLEAILLHGDPTKVNDLRVEDAGSPLYEFAQNYTGTCTLTLQVPAQRIWMAWLKVGCMEGHRPAVSGRHYGMKVVALG